MKKLIALALASIVCAATPAMADKLASVQETNSNGGSGETNPAKPAPDEVGRNQDAPDASRTKKVKSTDRSAVKKDFTQAQSGVGKDIVTLL